MITSFPFTMADAPALASGQDDLALRRLILEFAYFENKGNEGRPYWSPQGETYVLAATFNHTPSESEIELAITAACAVFSDSACAQYQYCGHEVVTGEELCAYERQQVEYARSMPEYYGATDLVYGVTSAKELKGDHAPALWSPASYARALIAARDEGLKAYAQAA
jgi:hypothetical protein